MLAPRLRIVGLGQVPGCIKVNTHNGRVGEPGLGAQMFISTLTRFAEAGFNLITITMPATAGRQFIRLSARP